MIQATIMLCRSPLGNGLFRLDSAGFSPKILWPRPFISPSRLPTPVSGLPSIRFPSTASSLRKQLLRERAPIFRLPAPCSLLSAPCSLLPAPFDTLSFDCFATSTNAQFVAQETATQGARFDLPSPCLPVASSPRRPVFRSSVSDLPSSVFPTSSLSKSFLLQPANC